MYQPKVSTTQKYSDSQGEHLVHKGKLVLLRDKESEIEANTLGQKSKTPKSKPIIISEAEEIEIGDCYYDISRRSINKCTDRVKQSHYNAFRDRYKKVLALPEHFSDKHLQAIVDGKMKDGDEVLLKCISCISYESKKSDIQWDKVYLDQQNHITLFPPKQSLEEACEEYILENPAFAYGKDSLLERGFLAGAEWAKKNNY